MKLHDPTLFSHQWVEDIVYFEGPLLALLRDVSGEQYLYYWTGHDAFEGESVNCWLAVKVTDEQIAEYKAKRFTLLQIVRSVPQVYLVSIDEDLKTRQVVEINSDDVPLHLLPPNDSFYDKELAP